MESTLNETDIVSTNDDELINHLMDRHKLTHKRSGHLTEQEERRVLAAMRELKNTIIKRYQS